MGRGRLSYRALNLASVAILLVALAVSIGGPWTYQVRYAVVALIGLAGAGVSRYARNHAPPD
jgi:hypothetical protein